MSVTLHGDLHVPHDTGACFQSKAVQTFAHGRSRFGWLIVCMLCGLHPIAEHLHACSKQHAPRREGVSASIETRALLLHSLKSPLRHMAWCSTSPEEPVMPHTSCVDASFAFDVHYLTLPSYLVCIALPAAKGGLQTPRARGSVREATLVVSESEYSTQPAFRPPPS